VKFDTPPLCLLVAENMFGDIVSDLCTGLVGGFAPSANLGDKYAVFEPTRRQCITA